MVLIIVIGIILANELLQVFSYPPYLVINLYYAMERYVASIAHVAARLFLNYKLNYQNPLTGNIQLLIIYVFTSNHQWNECLNISYIFGSISRRFKIATSYSYLNNCSPLHHFYSDLKILRNCKLLIKGYCLEKVLQP